jgi:hypothetical protein
MRTTGAFVAGVLVAWLVSCAAGATGEKKGDYYKSPLGCRGVEEELNACHDFIKNNCVQGEENRD